MAVDVDNYLYHHSLSSSMVLYPLQQHGLHPGWNRGRCRHQPIRQQLNLVQCTSTNRNKGTARKLATHVPQSKYEPSYAIWYITVVPQHSMSTTPAHLACCHCLCREVTMSHDNDVTLSPSMMASDTHNTQPAAPVCQSVMGPGAQPRARATGPRIP